MVKRLIKSALSRPFLAGGIVKMALQLHNWSYRLAGQYSQSLEPDGLHPKHRLMRYHEWFKAQVKPHWWVLDIGCGNGALAYDLKECCAAIVGIDINPRNIDIAQSRFSRKGITYLCGDATKWKFTEKFDAIVLSNVLEHIEDRVEFLQAIYARQDPANSPVLLLRVPMLTRDWITLYKREQGIEWRLDPTHFTEYTLQSLLAELQKSGLEVESYEIQFGEFYGIIRRESCA
jgi:SAM-dependent methyltransferase